MSASRSRPAAASPRPGGRAHRAHRARLVAAAAVTAALAAGVAGAAAGDVLDLRPEGGLLDWLELSFAGARADPASVYPRLGLDPALVARALGWHAGLAVAVSAAASAWCLVGARGPVAARFRSPPLRRAAQACSVAVAVPLACDLVAVAALARANDLVAAGGGAAAGPWFQVALAVTIPQWLVLIVCLPMAAAAAWVTVRPWSRRAAEPAPAAAGTFPDPPADRPFGICLSGGGIRSASFALGLLQVLMTEDQPGHDRPVFERASFLASVSGGGYLAGALQILVHRLRGGGNGAPPVAPPPFAPRSPEVDHLRRHGRYVADTRGQWVLGAARVAAGFLMNQLLFLTVLFVIGRPVGWVQAGLLFPDRATHPQSAVAPGIWGAIGWTAALAALVQMTAIILSPDADATSRGRGGLLWRGGGLLWRASGLFALLSLGVVMLAVVLPVVVAALGYLRPGLLGGLQLADTALAVLAGTATTATLVSFKRRPARPDGDGGSVRAPAFGRLASVAPRVAGWALVLLAVTVVGVVAAGAHKAPTDPTAGVPDVELWLAAVLALIVANLLVDQTAWSLHPLYKRRLASAFAIERRGGGAGELPYEVPTRLADYLAPVELAVAGRATPVRFPTLVVCAAANVSGQSLAPPGRRAVPFTFEHDRVGGDDVGWTTPAHLEAALGRYRNDVTALGAMAMSGAAFASAMGRETKGSINALLAAADLRLGVWVPNPRRVGELAADARFLRRRPLGYLFKELLGIFGAEDRFLYVTDGGHLENLGLVEVLRRRCLDVIAVDASGDPPTFPTALAQAIALAEETLPVSISFPRGSLDDLVPGSAPAEPGAPADPLQARYARAAVAVGEILCLETGRRGRLVYARATMTPGGDPFVRQHAARSPRFPNDGTSDQFFDQGQFDAYLRLGRVVGRELMSVLADLADPDPAGVEPLADPAGGAGRPAAPAGEGEGRAPGPAPAVREPVGGALTEPGRRRA